MKDPTRPNENVSQASDPPDVLLKSIKAAVTEKTWDKLNERVDKLNSVMGEGEDKVTRSMIIRHAIDDYFRIYPEPHINIIDELRQDKDALRDNIHWFMSRFFEALDVEFNESSKTAKIVRPGPDGDAVAKQDLKVIDAASLNVLLNELKHDLARRSAKLLYFEKVVIDVNWFLDQLFEEFKVALIKHRTVQFLKPDDTGHGRKHSVDYAEINRENLGELLDDIKFKRRAAKQAIKNHESVATNYKLSLEELIRTVRFNLGLDVIDKVEVDATRESFLEHKDRTSDAIKESCTAINNFAKTICNALGFVWDDRKWKDNRNKQLGAIAVEYGKEISDWMKEVDDLKEENERLKARGFFGRLFNTKG